MDSKILTYPDSKLLRISGVVREFDENLFKLLDEMKKISKANNLKGLAAIQIGIPLKVIVYKKDNDFIELINPTIFFNKGLVDSQEEDESIPGHKFDIKRYKEIKISYVDRYNKQHFLTVDGEDAIWLQRKIDFTFGGLPINKLPKKEAKKFIKEYGSGEACPTTFVKDKILLAVKISVILEFLTFLATFFIKSINSSIISYWSILNILAIVFYLYYANYETKKYKNCTSCQGANAIGNALIWGSLTIGIFLLNFIF
ncbi:peptide deformylase [Nitrosophilus kaiyonis]|uniref:peptide deformylase n=1 Tax=Nitrosophilus kaiyonis TaxID=2930200 RepID=UPI002492E2B0|nr:peptide deformylase [Nitrosophilus kaiyonis]